MYFAEYLTIDINNIHTIKSTRLSHVHMYCVSTVDDAYVVNLVVKFVFDSRTVSLFLQQVTNYSSVESWKLTDVKFIAIEQLTLPPEAKNYRDPNKQQKSDWQTISAATHTHTGGGGGGEIKKERKEKKSASPVSRTVCRGVVVIIVLLLEETRSGHFYE
jgi:hypothetical protein